MERSKFGIVSDTNLYQNCYNISEGGVYFLQNTKLKDTVSTYKNIQSVFGGVLKCADCEFSIMEGTMDYNRAVYGGVFMVENAGQGIITSTSFINATALMQGGVMSIQQSGVSKEVYSSITFYNCMYIEDTYAGQGGVFFISQPYISVYLNKIKISNPSAFSGGVAFIENARRFEIIDSEISDFKAN